MRFPRLLILMVLFLLIACNATPGNENGNPAATESTGADATVPRPTVTTAATENVAVTTTQTREPATTENPASDAPTPATLPGLPLPPTRLEEVPGWLNTVAENGNPMEDARAALLDSQWLESESDFRLSPMRGDGNEVWVVRATRPIAEGEYGNPYGLPGGVFVVDPHAGALVYEQFGQASIESEAPFFPSPTVLTDTDFTGDQVLDLLFKLTNCGANTCYDEYHIVSYQDGDTPRDVIRASGYTYDGQISDDLPFVTMSYSDAYLGDDSGDSITDLQLVGGTQGSVGAGPQRSRSETYGWDGEYVVLLLTEFEDSPYRYFKLMDANTAFSAEDYPTARTLYDEVISRDDLEDLGYFADVEDERAAMTRYATYRLMLLDILEEDFVGAQTRAETMVAEYPEDVVATGALETVMTFARTSSLSEACATFTKSVEGIEPDPVAPLDYMGYANPELGAETLCPF